MEEKVLNRKDIPMGYALCFNNECTKKDGCMHYQARLLMAEDRYSGQAVFPTAWQNGGHPFRPLRDRLGLRLTIG